MDIALNVNGREHSLSVDVRTTLLDLLRERLGLTGSKKGCDQGQCGACTVLLDGLRVNACLVLAAPQAALDLPLRALVRADADGRTLVAFHPIAPSAAGRRRSRCPREPAGAGANPSDGGDPTMSEILAPRWHWQQFRSGSVSTTCLSASLAPSWV